MAIALWGGAIANGNNTTHVNLNNINIVEGHSTTVSVRLASQEIVRDVLFDIFLPNEVTLGIVSFNESLTGHELMTNVLETSALGTTMRFGIVSDKGSILLSNDSTVLVTLTLTGNTIVDTYGRLDDVSVSTDNDLTIIQDNSSFAINVVADSVADNNEYLRICELINAQKTLRGNVIVAASNEYSKTYVANYNAALSLAQSDADSFHAAIASHKNIETNEANVAALATAVTELSASVRFDEAYQAALSSYQTIKATHANYTNPSLPLNTDTSVKDLLDEIKAAADDDALVFDIAANVDTYIAMLAAIDWEEFANNIDSEKLDVQELTIYGVVTDNDAAYISSLPNLRTLRWESTESDIPAGIINENCVNAIIYTHKGVKVDRDYNVVVDGMAENIILTDAAPITIADAFRAKHITYSRVFSKPTIAKKASGWESLILPFAVQTMTAEKKGEIVPYGVNKEGAARFWLAEAKDDALSYVTEIKANVPYILSMPNDSTYPAIYNISGTVEFCAEDSIDGVEVYPTAEAKITKIGDYELIPAYEAVAQAENVYALNDEKTGNYEAGAVFVHDSRDVRPFECYVAYAGAPGRQRYVTIGMLFGEENGIDGIIADTKNDDSRKYNISGQRLNGTAKGVIIYKGKKFANR